MRQSAQRFSGAVVPVVLWLWLCNHLRAEWTLNAQYNYGWGVPFLAAFMFYLRWPSRPAAEPQYSLAARVAQWTLLALLLPLRAIEEANPDWRLLSWALALVVVGYTLIALFLAGGGGWVRHFAFPVCFPLVAVPWLVQFENVVVQALTRAVAYAAVEIAGWIGVGAVQLGNVIELHNGFVGVDEACSGVKTLQAAIMVSLVLGELLQLKAARRIALIFLGCVWVFTCNILRAAALVIIAARNGTEALHRWHDAIGTGVMIAGMAGLLVIAWLLSKRRSEAKSDVDSVGRDSVEPGRWPAQLPDSRESRPTAGGERSSMLEVAVILASLVAIFAATELWYRGHESQLIARPAWQAQWPSANGTRQLAPISDATRAILRYDEASSAAWEEPKGTRWWGFFARWEPRRAALQLVRSHSPEICLPAAGRIFRAELPPVTVATDRLPLVFRAFEFEQNRRPLFVFVCIQEDKIARTEAQATTGGFSARSRLLAVRSGRRNLGQRLLELAVTGVGDAAAAREALNRTVRATVAEQPTG